MGGEWPELDTMVGGGMPTALAPTHSPVVQHGRVHGLGGHREEPQQPLLPGLQCFLQEKQVQRSGQLWHAGSPNPCQPLEPKALSSNVASDSLHEAT